MLGLIMETLLIGSLAALGLWVFYVAVTTKR